PTLSLHSFPTRPSSDLYRVIVANNGVTALNIYKKLPEQVDLVILDFTMPIMDGSEVFNELRRINPRVAVMLSSGFTENEKLKFRSEEHTSELQSRFDLV